MTSDTPKKERLRALKDKLQSLEQRNERNKKRIESLGAKLAVLVIEN